MPHDLDPIEERRAWRALVEGIAPLLVDDNGVKHGRPSTRDEFRTLLVERAEAFPQLRDRFATVVDDLERAGFTIVRVR